MNAIDLAINCDHINSRDSSTNMNFANSHKNKI